MKDRTRKTLYIAVIAALAAFAVTLYVIELLTSEPVFGVTSFSLNYVLSLPFLLLSLIIDIGMAVLMNRPAMRKRSVGLRLLGEGVLAVIVSGILVAAVNLPFISDMGEYIRSVQFWKSVYAAALINIFILAAAEFVNAINTLLSFRLGTDRFYTIFSGGINYFLSPLEYAVGLGFGTSIGWKKHWSNQIEIQAFGVSVGQKLSSKAGTANSLIQLRLPVCKEFARHFKIFVGPTVNLALQSNDAEGNALPSLAPWTMWSGQCGSMRAEGWVGLSAGLRF